MTREPGPVPFRIFKNYLGDWTEFTFRTFADATELGEVADILEGYVDTQKDVNRLEKEADRNLMNFNKKCKVLYLREKGEQPHTPYFVGQRSRKEICRKDLLGDG